MGGKVASKMNKRELEYTVKRLAENLNSVVIQSNTRYFSERFENILTSNATYLKDVKTKKGETRTGFKVGTSGMNKDQLIKRVAEYNSLLNDIELSKKKYKQLITTSKKFGIRSSQMRKILDAIHSSRIEEYEYIGDIIESIKDNKDLFKNMTADDFKDYVDKFISQQKQKQGEVSIDELFNEIRRGQLTI